MKTKLFLIVAVTIASTSALGQISTGGAPVGGPDTGSSMNGRTNVPTPQVSGSPSMDMNAPNNRVNNLNRSAPRTFPTATPTGPNPGIDQQIPR